MDWLKLLLFAIMERIFPMTNKVEILAPAGNMECLIAALHAGADAIYCAGANFGARAYAANFDNEQMARAVTLVHQYGAKLYVTMNTLLFEDEIESAMDQVAYYYKIGIDALLIQDLGFFDLIHQCYPDFELHCSTQMNIHDVNGVRFAKQIGAKRVVLARECSRSMVQACCKEGIEIEVFAYGALCSSYSGQCYISAYSQQRSGNRGACGQNCRLPYQLKVDGKLYDDHDQKHMMSLNDLNLLNKVKDLMDDGVSSLKIEGRMKSSAYVYYVTSLFVKARNMALKGQSYKISTEEEKTLKLLFNRGFTLGYYYSQHDRTLRSMHRPNHMGIPVGKVLGYKNGTITIKCMDTINQGDGLRALNDTKDQGIYVHTMKLNHHYVTSANKGDIVDLVTNAKVNVNDIIVKTSDQILLDSINQSIDQSSQQLTLSIDIDILNKKTLTIYGKDNLNRALSKTYTVDLQQSDKANILHDSLVKSFTKIKETPFKLNELTVSDDYYFLSMSSINALRRDFMESFLLSLHKNRNNVQPLPYQSFTYDIDCPKPLVWLEKEDINKRFSAYRCVSSNVNYGEKIQPLIHLDNEITEGEVIQYIGDIDGKFHIALSSIPLTNSYTLQFLLQHNTVGTVNYECNEQQVNQLMEAYTQRNNQKPLVYQCKEGTFRLMSMNDCLVKSILQAKVHCQMCHQHTITLTDRNQNTYRVEGDENCILHCYSTTYEKYSIHPDAIALMQWL